MITPDSPEGNNPARTVPRLDVRWLWLIAGGLVALLRGLLRNNPPFTEVAYSRGVFAVERFAWDYTLGWMPLPWVYLLPFFALGWFFFLRKKKKRTGWHRVIAPLLSLLALAAAVYCLFMVGWGYNYHRMPLENQAGIEGADNQTLDIGQEYHLATDELLVAFAALPPSPDSFLLKGDLPPQLEQHVREDLVSVFHELEISVAGRPRVKALWPQGLLMQLGASGVYLPWTFEAVYDPAMPAATIPFTLAHEMSHGYGFAREEDCNFLAWLACAHDTDPVVRYAGALGYWRYVANAYRKVYPEIYAATRDSIPEGVWSDIRAIQQTLVTYPGFFPKFSEKTYDAYLKKQGVAKGSASYSRVIQLVHAWREAQAKKE